MNKAEIETIKYVIQEYCPLNDLLVKAVLKSLDDYAATVAQQPHLTELQKDAVPLLFALCEAWPYVHARCTIKSRKDEIQRLLVKHGDFADYWKEYEATKQPQAEAVPPDVARDAAPIPDHELVTMYDERPTSDLEMIEFAREVERRHGIGVQPQHITDGSPCWCNPDVAYTDPETGASVIVHRRPQ